MNEREMVVVPMGFNCDFAMIMECEYMVNVGIQPGDMLYFRAQQTAESGDLVLVLVEGETRLRRIIFGDNSTFLQTFPTKGAPVERYKGADRKRVEVLGKLVGLARSLERTDAPNED